MTGVRCLLSAALSLVLYGWCYHPWLAYAVRERSQTGTGLLVLMGGALAGGFLLGRGLGKQRYRVALAFLGALFAANVLVIALDLREDPASHNLLPFEFIMLGFLGSPAFLGAMLAGRGAAPPATRPGRPA
jgi:hypothetical protein